jgi:hypothetical protein
MPNKVMRFNILPGGLINPEVNGRYVRFDDIEALHARLATADKLLRDIVRDGSSWQTTANHDLRTRLTAYTCQHPVAPSVPDTPPTGETQV